MRFEKLTIQDLHGRCKCSTLVLSLSLFISLSLFLDLYRTLSASVWPSRGKRHVNDAIEIQCNVQAGAKIRDFIEIAMILNCGVLEDVWVACPRLSQFYDDLYTWFSDKAVSGMISRGIFKLSVCRRVLLSKHCGTLFIGRIIQPH